jgi:hypothetical protein
MRGFGSTDGGTDQRQDKCKARSIKRSHGQYSCKEGGRASCRRNDSGGGASNDGRDRDKVLEAKRRADYKSVIDGLFDSDFSLKLRRTCRRLK